MVDWRTLGEIPDSEDDDGFDSQQTAIPEQLPVEPPTGAPIPAHSPLPAPLPDLDVAKTFAKDIWDIPSSQEGPPITPAPLPLHASPRPKELPAQPAPVQSEPWSSPLSSPLSSPVSPPLSSQELPPIEELVVPLHIQDPSLPLPSSATPRPTPTLHTASTQAISHISEPDGTETPLRLISTQAPAQSQILGHDVELQEVRRAAFQYERSLRTRKPEQMRPYFMEQARFNNEWRQHGLRPLRVSYQHRQHEIRHQERNSQERDFEPESQDSIGHQQPTDESQLPASDDDLMDGLRFPDSSSPAKTSPLNNRGGPLSSQGRSHVDTDGTSLDGDDLPSLQDLVKHRRLNPLSRKTAKRRLSSVKSATKKRPRLSDPAESPESLKPHQAFIRPPDSSNPYEDFDEPSPDAGEDVSPPHARRGTGAHVRKTHQAASTPSQHTASTIPAPLVINSDSDQDTERPEVDGSEADDSTDSDDSGDGSDIVHQNSRRIRGVLPASWLRIDQMPGCDKVQERMRKRRLEHSPERNHRRGVAQRRQADPSTINDKFLFEDTDDEETQPSQVQPTTDDTFHRQTRLHLQPIPDNGGALDDMDDGISIVEEDLVNFMVSRNKRQTNVADAFQKASKRPKTCGSQPTMIQARLQPKITGAFPSSFTPRPAAKVSSAARKQTKKTRQQSAYPRNTGNLTHAQRPRPPQLSVLDVIEPDAPRFLKIAARTARGRRDQGRSKPGKKSIRMATRADHVDAASVLLDWTSGSIKQRPSVTVAKRTRQARPQLRTLTELSANAPKSTSPSTWIPGNPRRRAVPTLGLDRNVPHKLQLPLDGNDDTEKEKLRTRNSAVKATAPRVRPAQLEMDYREEMNATSFHAGKRLLDRLYRSKNLESTVASSVLSDSNIGHAITPEPSTLLRTSSLSTDRPSFKNSKDEVPKQRRPTKKGRPPQRVDIEAPQYSHANDPLPTKYAPSQVPQPQPSRLDTETAKLVGLGSYGTQFTHHFEMFPLDVGVYFHESTLLGSGMVERVLHGEPRNGTDCGDDTVWPRATFTLGEQTMRWGPWSAQVSSEMGIVLDHMAEQLEKTPLPGVEAHDAPSAVTTAHHILVYIEGSLTFNSQPQLQAFVGRFIEIVQSFNSRALSCIAKEEFASGNSARIFLGACDRLVLATFRSWALLKKEPTMMGEKLQMEELLIAVAAVIVKALSRLGLDSMRTIYKELQNSRFRERGLRTDATGTAMGIHSWVLILRVLEIAAIPRASFWDLVQTEFVQPGLVSSVDAREHERLWEDMFTLLPLIEFNDMGVLVPGRRYQNTTDGWGIPQRILKRIFQLYRDNPRQPPSFNNYCRALVARCHYLVQQWGWQRCSSIVGLIFDFFGSQNLAHLRNEESYSSPRFLEELSRNPSLQVEPEDRCFHIFLKLVALSILKLKESGDSSSTKDIRNLVARTVPNHNRQYLKEQRIHERDLAALRNHHDLLCTLYWAAPPDQRPSVGLLERLVVPASSHKEACLINMRAWSQLARYIVATGQATICFKPFNQWRNTCFQQMIQQFDEAAADIERQFQGLSKDVTKTISQDMINAMVAMNKTATMDVLHFSVSASLDVMKHTPDLETATFAMSSLQLQRVFQHFSDVPPELDWAILRAALSTLDVFLAHVDKFKDEEESQQSESQILNSAQADDALLVLHQDLAKSFFTMARRVLSPRSAKKGLGATPAAVVDRAASLEQVTVLSARMGLRFANACVMRLSDMFKPGKHGIFAALPHLLGLEERRYLSLFVATLLKNGYDDNDSTDLSDAGFTLRELWMLSIVKPRESLGFENELAEQLARRGKKFVPDTVVGLATTPDYNMNRDLFQFAISSMRRSVRDAEPRVRKAVIAEDSKTLKLVMEQIKGDLKTVAEQDASEHGIYVSFVRDIIALIRAHGSDICSVDDFFYQISKEYSPSVRDPQLQVAAMISYGLRLTEEGDGSRTAHQLFFFLFNNFKLAMMNDKLGEEVGMLRCGLQDPGILNFVLGNMLPAAIRASADEEASSLLVDVYAHSCWIHLDGNVAPQQLTEGNLRHVMATLGAIIDGLVERSSRRQDGRPLSNTGIHMIGQFLGIMNMLWPSIHVLHMLEASPEGLDDVRCLLGECRSFTLWVETYMEEEEMDLTPGALKRGLDKVHPQQKQVKSKPETSRKMNPLVASFKDNIISDVRRNWIVSEERLTIQAPGKAQNTQSSRGVERALYDEREVLMDVLQRAIEWNTWWDKVFATSAASSTACYRRGARAIAIAGAPLF
ncbi:Mus7/MMS22 family [Geosmithia morbida]|uniref:Mus7/MMS22 family n=1 Tax=Geosmithia morbida TaxID=1094350 RepID=A0A9P5D2M5_9HYPO|nr:Mus7/MMS22 family [Geosmithia morbida]KAF4120965.1 Mus7/MMS22 family [Geosmithia morbida]